MILIVCLTFLFFKVQFNIYSIWNLFCSVRVSNELGAGHPRATKFSVIIVVATSLLIGIICMVILLLVKDKFSVLFTNSKVIQAAVSKLAIFLAVTMLLNSVQPVLSGTILYIIYIQFYYSWFWFELENLIT